MSDQITELKNLVQILVDWAAPAPGWTFYLIGSRVRGDHRQDSDVDIVVDWGDLHNDVESIMWWERNNETDFAELNARLPGRLHIPPNEETRRQAKAGHVVYQQANVICVWTPPKSA